MAVTTNESVETIDTTLGELIEAITQIALEAGNTEEEGYKLASLALSDLLRRSNYNS